MIKLRTLCWCWLAVGACSEPVSEASHVTYARVAGVRVEVEGDPQRATPRIDEAAHATVLVIGPDGPTAVTYAMLLCPAPPAVGSLPTCAGPTITTVYSDSPTTAPILQWPAITEDQRGEADELLLLGTVCEVGVPDVAMGANAARTGACVDPSFVGVSFAARVSLLIDDESVRNHHPTMTSAEVFIDGTPWTADTCVDAPRDGQEHTISVTLNDPAREIDNGEPEELLLSWFTTAGDLDRHFSVLERDQPIDTPLIATWTAPDTDSSVTQERVHFTLVLRDQRGGIDWITRTLCPATAAP